MKHRSLPPSLSFQQISPARQPSDLGNCEPESLADSFRRGIVMERRSPGNPRRSCRRPGIPGPLLLPYPSYSNFPRFPRRRLENRVEFKTRSSKPVLSLSLSPHKGFARKFAEKRERERHGAKTAWRRPRDDAMLVSRSSSPMRLAGERARDKDGERRRARWGKREGERGGVRRYFAVDAAGSIAWRAEEVEREPSERGTERRGGLERIGVCACVYV